MTRTLSITSPIGSPLEVSLNSASGRFVVNGEETVFRSYKDPLPLTHGPLPNRRGLDSSITIIYGINSYIEMSQDTESLSEMASIRADLKNDEMPAPAAAVLRLEFPEGTRISVTNHDSPVEKRLLRPR